MAPKFASLLLSIRPLARPLVAALAMGSVLVAAGLAPHARAADPAAAEKVADKVFSGEQKRAIEEIVKDYLINNPEVFLEIQQSLEAKMDKIQAEKLKSVIAESAKEIYHDPKGAVAGNANGNITVVEFFDYNCGYCKRSFQDVAKLIGSDAGLRIVFKELPILSKGSEEASRVALAARIQGKYWEMHRAIFESRAPANEANSLKLAEKLGLDMSRLKADMNGPEVKAELEKTKQLAQRMGINGTPHFLVGDRSIPGAPENLVEQINGLAADLRKNGCGVC